MEVIVSTPKDIAQKVANIYIELLSKKQDAVLGFATGSSPVGVYECLVRAFQAGKVSFQGAQTFNLDEYVGLESSHDQSYRHFMDVHLFSQIDVCTQAIHIPSGIHTSAETLAAYDAAIAQAGGIDIQLLGIGCNGHIGFNEPGTPFESTTHVVELTQSTREVNARFFGCVNDVPTHAATMGIKSVMNARKVVLIALGEEKACALAMALEGPVCVECPASVLQLHPQAMVFCDEPAASQLKETLTPSCW